MAPGILPGALVYPSPRQPRFLTASSAVFQGPPIDFLFRPLKTLSGALEAPQRPMGKTRRSERTPTYTKSRSQARRPPAGREHEARPPHRPRKARRAAARQEDGGSPPEPASPWQEHHPGRAGQDAAQPRRPATGPGNPTGGRAEPRGSRGRTAAPDGQPTGAPLRRAACGIRQAGPGGEPGRRFRRGRTGERGRLSPAGSEATEDEKGPANRPGPPSGADRPPQRGPRGALKLRPGQQAGATA